jgi:hypothetical protein
MRRARRLAGLVLATWLAVPCFAQAAGFPREDADYHDYAELTSHVRKTAAAHPAIVRRLSLGRSHQDRSLWAVKVSDNVGIDEAEPEVSSPRACTAASTSRSRWRSTCSTS